MLALALYRSRLCPRCNNDLRETTADEREGRYIRDLPLRCYHCDALIQSEEAYAKNDRPAALLHRATFRPRRG